VFRELKKLDYIYKEVYKPADTIRTLISAGFSGGIHQESSPVPPQEHNGATQNEILPLLLMLSHVY